MLNLVRGMKLIKRHKRKAKFVSGLLLVAITLQVFGVFALLREKDFRTAFQYPYNGDFALSAYQVRNGLKPDVTPINNYNYSFIYEQRHKCTGSEPIRLVYLIKSSPEHFQRRSAIRSTWGYEKRFSDVEIRRVFMLGNPRNAQLQQLIDSEQARHEDILQSDFIDSYSNNTIKTMMGFKWAVNFCSSAKFYMFADDDYYISTKNVLRFVRNPAHYPEYVRGAFKQRKMRNAGDSELPDDVKLYAGYRFDSKPLRHYFSKFYISLAEYPFNRWPPYITAGAYLLSREALAEMYFASFFTQHFRFDDIYIALLAFRTSIEPMHCEEFYFAKKEYSKEAYTFTVASHGFDDPAELISAWNEQKAAGNA